MSRRANLVANFEGLNRCMGVKPSRDVRQMEFVRRARVGREHGLILVYNLSIVLSPSHRN